MEKINKINNSQYEMEITLNEKEVAPYMERALQEEIKKVKEPGFRPGKMPKAIFLKKYGVQALNPACVDLIINDVYPKIINDNKLNVVAYPEFDWSTLKISKDGFYVKGTVEVLPEFELPNLEEIKSKIKKKELKVTKKEIKTEIENILAKDATYETQEDKEAKLGDIVVLDFVGYLDGEAFDGGSGEDYSLTLGSNSFIPGFEDQLVGTKAGEKKDVEVTFPKEYPAEELSGKDVVFKCEVKEVKKRTLPKLTAKKIESLPGFEVKTKEELEAKIEEMLLGRKEQTLNFEYEKEVLEKILKVVDIKIPQSMIDEETNHTIQNLEATYKQQGFSLEMYLQMVGMDLETLKKQLNKESELRVAKQLIIDTYLKNNKVKVSKKEIDDEIKLLMKNYNMTEEEITQRLGEDKAPLIRDIEYKKANEAIFL